MLKLSIDDLSGLFKRYQLKEVTKTTAFIENKLEQIEDLKRQVQESMFQNEKEVKEISKWDHQLEDRLKELIQGRLEMEATIEKLRIAEEEKSRTEETVLEAIKLLKGIQEGLKIEEARVKMRADLERKTRGEERNDAKPEIKVKLPKLEITKVKRNQLDWMLFWNQCETDGSIVTITGSEVFLPKIISGTESEINDRRSLIYI